MHRHGPDCLEGPVTRDRLRWLALMAEERTDMPEVPSDPAPSREGPPYRRESDRAQSGVKSLRASTKLRRSGKRHWTALSRYWSASEPAGVLGLHPTPSPTGHSFGAGSIGNPASASRSFFIPRWAS